MRLSIVEEGLQNEGGGNLVDDVVVLLAGVAGFVKNLVGRFGGEAFIPHVNGQAAEIAELCGKVPGAGGAGTFFAGEVKGIADDDARRR